MFNLSSERQQRSENDEARSPLLSPARVTIEPPACYRAGGLWTLQVSKPTLNHHDQRQLSSLPARPKPLLPKSTAESRTHQARTQAETAHTLGYRGNSSRTAGSRGNQRIMGQHRPRLFFLLLQLQTKQPRRPESQVDETSAPFLCVPLNVHTQ
ncbi:hypothetical protein ACER0C_023767 [Sarotherodon galilaeus]